MSPSIQIRVDGREMDSQEILEQQPLYHGALFRDDVYIHCNIKLTDDGIDGILKFGNEIVIIEPLKNLWGKSSKDDYSETYRKRLEVYPSIFYRPEDIIDVGRYDKLISKQYSQILRDKAVKSRVKRSTEYTECSLHLVTDHKFYEQIGNSDITTTIAEIMYHVAAVNTIFRSHDFDGDGSSDNIGFSVQNITIYTTNLYKMNESTLGHDFLQKFAKYHFDEVCLGVALSNRNWADVLGAAYMASSDGSTSGGICEKRDSYYKKNLNTLVMTFKMNFARMPVFQTIQILAHEIGHSFGSPHDTQPGCKPTGPKGKYIMWASITSELLNNSYIFSPCSIANIYPVIVNKGTCLTKTTEVCGNAIKEEHEECDCGKSSICDLIDPSCTPSDASNSNPDPPCTLRKNGGSPSPTNPPSSPTTNPPMSPTNPPQSPTNPPSSPTNPPPSVTANLAPSSANPSPSLTTNPPLSPTNPPTSPTNLPCQCSSVYSPCCTAECQYAPSGKPCRFAGECVKPTNCSGTSGDCPQITFEPNKKLCNNNKNTCISGRCIGSVCSYFNSTECDCSPGSFECHVCCLTETNQCLPAIINNNTYITKLVGSSCNQMQGFCDEHMDCVLENPYMDFIQLGNIFSPKAVNELGEWFQVYWYYVVAGLAGLLFLAAVFFATCWQRLDVQTSAFMYGQFMRIKHDAEIQKKYIEERRKSVELEYKSKMENVDQGSKRMGLTKAFARMKEFFPTTPDEELKKVLKICSKEEMAVYLILMKGFPLRRLKHVNE